ncbi:MAG: SCO2322 family protein [Actinomycetes bacterium]
MTTSTTSPLLRRAAVLAASLLTVTAALLGPGALASWAATAPGGSTDTPTSTGAATAGYRFWGYFQQVDGAWEFAQTGPADTKPQDGAVEGWRFAAAASDDPRFPRAIPAFADVCGNTKATGGEKRVAVVLDYGRVADNADGAEPPKPRAACAVVRESGTGSDVLAAVAEVRTGEGGLTCAVDGFPATGCGDPVNPLPAVAVAPDEQVQLTGVRTDDSNDATDGAESSDGGPGTALWVGVGAVVLAAVIGFAALRRRSTD